MSNSFVKRKQPARGFNRIIGWPNPHNNGPINNPMRMKSLINRLISKEMLIMSLFNLLRLFKMVQGNKIVIRLNPPSRGMTIPRNLKCIIRSLCTSLKTTATP